MEKPKYFLIDSRDRTNGVSHNFQIQLDAGLDRIKSVKLLCVSLPLTNYTINSSNNLIYFNDGADEIATIPPGSYDYNSILTAIQTAMTTAGYGGVVTATYDNVTMKFTIATSTAIIFTWSNTTNSAAYILGWNNGDTLLDTSHTSTNISHLSVPSTLYIIMDYFPNLCQTTYLDYCTFIIFSEMVSGYNTYHFANTQYIMETSNNSHNRLQNFNVNIKTRGGQLFDMNGVDWNMLLELEYY